MTIRRVQAFPVRYPEPNDLNNIRYLVLVKIETDEGTAGWGECITMWPETSRAVKVLIEDGLANVIVGRDPLDVHALHLAMKDHTWWYGDTGMAMFAISAIDIALWDLKGKLLGVPVHQLLGGKVHDRLRACASTHPNKPDIDDLAEELATHVRNGYTCVKVGFHKTGQANLGTDPRRDTAYVRAVREAIGDEADFIVDVSRKTRWDAAMAVRMVKAFEAYRIRWIEDPLPHHEIEGYRRLQNSTQTPVATGEREWTALGYKRLMDAGIGDIYLVDPGRAEGITGFRKVIELAELNNKKINAHTFSSAINTAASIHLTATTPNYIVLEMKPLDNPMQHELVREPFAQRGGYIDVPDEPGLGIDVDERVVAHYAFA